MTEKKPIASQIEELKTAILARKKVSVNGIQEQKLEHACYRCYVDNPEANFKELVIAGSVYLNFILDFPDLTLK